MKLKKILGCGALVWLIMFAVVSAFLNQYNASYLWHLIFVLVGAVVAYVVASYAKPASYKEAVKIGVAWVLVGIFLDYLVTYQYDQAIFRDGMYWLSYALILFVPALHVSDTCPEGLVNQTQ